MCGAWWALVVEVEGGREALFPYPQTTVFTHVAAAIVCAVYVVYRVRLGVIALNEWDVLWIWTAYAGWVVFVMLLKARQKLPPTDVDMLPIGIVGRLCARCWRGVASQARKVDKWFRTP
jgi:hypothetical protein